VFIYDAAGLIRKAGHDAINSFAEGEQRDSLIEKIEILTKVAPVNVKAARRRITDKLIDDGRSGLRSGQPIAIATAERP